jgi:hypothetical protein
MRTLFAGVVLAMTLPAGAADKLGMRVSPAMVFEPATLRIQLSVEPDADNRALRVVAESVDFYRSSEIQMDGEQAPRSSVVSYRSLPAGDYSVQGVLIGANGRVRAQVRQSVTVVAAGGL